MSLEELFHSLPPEQRIFQFGAETDSPLTDAFPRKRVVHAGLHGTVVPPDESQQVWQRIMASVFGGEGQHDSFLGIVNGLAGLH